MRFNHFGTASVAVLAAVAFAGAANAQQAEPGVTDRAQDTALTDPTAATQDQGARTVEEIVVTAQKREQSLQDVPIVVTAVSEQQLQDAGVRDIKDLTVLTPGLTVTSTSSEASTTARIRGVGTVGDNPGLESSVGVVIDGVYRPRNGVGFNDLGQIERIEVLKGPQGTLFGKNTSAGVINVISKAPEFEFGLDSEVSVTNFEGLDVSAGVTGPLADNLAGRLFVARRMRDGFLDVATGEGPRAKPTDNDRDYYTARGQLLWTPTANLDARIIADYTKREEHCCAGVQVVNNLARQNLIDALATDSGVLKPAGPFQRLAFSNRDTDQNIEDGGVSAEVTWDLTDDITLTSISSYRQWETRNSADLDYTTADIWYRTPDAQNSTFSTWTQEVRLAGATDRLDWLVGGFLSREELDTNIGNIFGADYEPYFGLLLSRGASPLFITALTGRAPGTNFQQGLGSADQHSQETESVALFTNNTFRVTDALELTLGLRYSVEDKSLESRYSNTNGAAACTAATAPANAARLRATYGDVNAATFIGNLCLPWTNPNFNNRTLNQERSEEELTGTIKAAYRVSEDILTYASFARGYKAGGFNLDRELAAVNQNPFAATPADLNTGFDPEFVDSYEVGAKTEFLDNSLLLNATIFHQTYEGFQLNTFTGVNFVVQSIPEVVSRGVDADFLFLTPVEGLTVQGGVTYAETQYGDFVPTLLSTRRLPNSRVSLAPLWSSSAAVTYERPVGGMLARFAMQGKYSSSYNTGSDLSPSKVQDGFFVANARVGFGPEDGRWQIEAFAQNVFDEEYFQVAFDAPLQNDAANNIDAVNAFLGQPRLYGLTFRVNY